MDSFNDVTRARIKSSRLCVCVCVCVTAVFPHAEVLRVDDEEGVAAVI